MCKRERTTHNLLSLEVIYRYVYIDKFHKNKIYFL